MSKQKQKGREVPGIQGGKEQVFSFPHMGDYHVPIARLLENMFPSGRVLVPPPITKQTIALGSRYSPDFICAPFKFNVGNYIEALAKGANVLIQTGLGCRFGYFGEVQEQILRDLGYEFQFFSLARENARLKNAYQGFRQLGCPHSPAKFLFYVLIAAESIRIMDHFAFIMRERAGFAQRPGSFEYLYGCMLEELRQVSSIKELLAIRRQYNEAFGKVEMRQTQHLLRVGIVGELYTLMEPYSNLFIEKELARHNIMVSRRMSAAFLLFGKNSRKSLKDTGKYMRYWPGANATDSVAQSRYYGKLGYDGIIHMKSYGCTPEINAMPALHNVGKDYNIPILYLSFDGQTNETGVLTRLEAFVDMLEMRRKTFEEDGLSGRGHRFYFDKGSRS